MIYSRSFCERQVKECGFCAELRRNELAHLKNLLVEANEAHSSYNPLAHPRRSPHDDLPMSICVMREHFVNVRDGDLGQCTRHHRVSLGREQVV